LRYYRCIGADGYRFEGEAVCCNPPVRADQLERVVWEQVKALLEEPEGVADEFSRRIAQAADGAAAETRLDKQMTALRRGIGRLIDGYADGFVEKDEF
jgi:site-specific DNA recombinase